MLIKKNFFFFFLGGGGGGGAWSRPAERLMPPYFPKASEALSFDVAGMAADGDAVPRPPRPGPSAAIRCSFLAERKRRPDRGAGVRLVEEFRRSAHDACARQTD